MLGRISPTTLERLEARLPASRFGRPSSEPRRPARIFRPRLLEVGDGLIDLVGLQREATEAETLRRTDEFEAFTMKLSQLFDRLGVVPQKRLPGLRGWCARAHHVLSGGGFANVDSKLQEFAMNPWCSPTWVG
jgi:hypothetical protein